MPARNDVTGDSIVSKSSNEYRDNYDRIFGRVGRKREEDKIRSYVGDKTVESPTDNLQKTFDELVKASVTKEAYLISHCEEVKKIFDQLYPGVEITDEQIRLITLMWEERVKDEKRSKYED